MDEKRKDWLLSLLHGLLAVLILFGLLLRLNWANWSQGANLHPDEYGLTSTLTQLSLPDSPAEYFNTRISPLSPYPRYDLNGEKMSDGPDNRMRWGQWPIILLRAFAEWTGNTGYDEQRLLGRTLSALADILIIALLMLTGKRLYGVTAALLAGAFSSLAVLQIQQSHFMTVDTFAGLFVALALYAAVRAAQQPPLQRSDSGSYRARPWAFAWYALFGVAFGMAVASRINLVPLAGMILLAAFISIADLKLKTRADLQHIFLTAALYLALSGFLALLTFRVTHPMTFRAETGDTGFFTLHLNFDWTESMKVAQSESSGVGGGPPGEQWAHRPAIIFPLVNMVLWGMGLPLGLAAWGGFFSAGWQGLRGKNWRAHLIPLVWVGGYFLFMGTRWVKSMRYFLPIYPMLALLAAWALLLWWQSARAAAPRWKRVLPAVAASLVLLGTLAWAVAFVRAVYLQDHTRVQATRWIFQNVPAPFMLSLDVNGQPHNEPVGAPEFLILNDTVPYSASFRLENGGVLKEVALSRAAAVDYRNAEARVRIALDPQGSQVVAETRFPVSPPGMDDRGTPYRAAFTPVNLQPDQTYFMIADTLSPVAVQIQRTVIANESWDEGLPFPFENRDPFGSLYSGISNEVRWYDSPEKRQMFLEVLDRADYLIMPSQRAVWSAARIPLTYPMTLEYYRALFDGRLGFELAAEFQSPLVLGPLQISDVGGTLAWGKKPHLPLFNYSPIAAEEAFSVYDHPPVWIFRKRADFSIAQAAAVLSSVDLEQVVIQGPRDATWPD